MKKLLLALICLVLSGCYINNPNGIQVGMVATNGYCTGRVIAVHTNEALLLQPWCGNAQYNQLYIKLDDLKEAK